MITIQELKRKIVDEWPDRRVQELCLSLIDFMNNHDDEELSMLTYYSIRNAVGRSDVDEDLIRAVSLLVNTSVHALDSKLLFIDDDETHFPVEKDELAEARRTGVFIHPESGRAVPDFESKIIPYFVPSPEFLRLKAG